MGDQKKQCEKGHKAWGVSRKTSRKGHFFVYRRNKKVTFCISKLSAVEHNTCQVRMRFSRIQKPSERDIFMAHP